MMTIIFILIPSAFQTCESAGYPTRLTHRSPFPLWRRHTGQGEAVPHSGSGRKEIYPQESMDARMHWRVSTKRSGQRKCRHTRPVSFPLGQKTKVCVALGRHWAKFRTETEALLQAASVVQAADKDCVQVVTLSDASALHRLVGLVVRRLPRERQTWVQSPHSPMGFSRSIDTNLNRSTPVATPPGTWR